MSLVLGALCLIAVACAPETTPTADDESVEERRLVAGVNVAIADVPLDEIVFDTFDGGSITMAEADEELILALHNVIPPLDEPVYSAGSDADWLVPGDLVLGYVADDGSAWAHPHRILNFHEIVNVELAGRPIAVTYCPLCGSGVVFDRRPNDLRHQGTLTFGNTSALYQSDMVMVDAETNTYWWHLAGRGIVGNLTGSRLEILASSTTTWATWLELHPDTRVLSNDQGRGPRYERDPFVDYASIVDDGALRFPVSPSAFEDERLAPSSRVIGFEADGAWFAVPVLTNEPEVVPIVTEHFGPVVVLLDGAGGGSAFRTDGRVLDARDGAIRDGDGVVFDTAGRGADGAMLTPVSSSTAFWFAWVAATDGTTRLFGLEGEID